MKWKPGDRVEGTLGRFLGLTGTITHWTCEHVNRRPCFSYLVQLDGGESKWFPEYAIHPIHKTYSLEELLSS